MPRPAPGWSDGPARWAAAVVLGSACIAGAAWSIGREPRPLSAQTPRPVTLERAPASSAADRPTPAPRPAGLSVRININTAPAPELELLPGVGPALAARIIEHREKKGPFKRVDDLDRVKGIGPKTLERLRDKVSID